MKQSTNGILLDYGKAFFFVGAYLAMFWAYQRISNPELDKTTNNITVPKGAAIAGLGIGTILIVASVLLAKKD